MKKNILLVLLFVILWWLSSVYFIYIKSENNKLDLITQTNDNFSYVKKYLEANYNGNFPLPSWDLILLNKKWEMLHLEDRTIPLDKVKWLYSIQGTTCDILKNNKEFQSKNYDLVFSILDWKKVYKKRCFTYSVTKDWKYFQIWIVKKEWNNYVSKLDWNFKGSITKSYDSPILVKKDSEDFLPYSPNKISPILKIRNMWDSKLTLMVINDEWEEQLLKLTEWDNNVLSGDVNETYQISLKWIIDNKTDVSFIDTNGSIVYIKWDKHNNVDFRINNYEIDTNRINYAVETGRFLANIIKLSPNKEMNVSKSWTTLVIRWTKFSIDSEWDEMSTYLVLWKIVQKIKNGSSITLDMLNSFSSIFKNKKSTSESKMKQLVSYIVKNDVKTHPNYKFDVTHKDNITYLNYNNWENIILIEMDTDLFSKLLDENKWNYINSKEFKSCNGIKACEKEFAYKNMIDNYCIKNWFKNALDVSKMYYLFDISNNKLKLKKWIDFDNENSVIFTKRLWWSWDGIENNTTRVWFNNNTNSITNISLRRIYLWYSSLDSVVISCEN